MKVTWRVRVVKYRGKNTPCIIFEEDNAIYLTHGWTPDLFICLADQMDIEAGN